MAELLQEGMAVLVSLALGVSLLVLLQPGITSLENTLTDRGGRAILNDLKDLLETHEGYSVRLFIDKGVNGSYENGMLVVNLFGGNFSARMDLGPYRFQIHSKCVLESDGVGWRDLG